MRVFSLAILMVVAVCGWAQPSTQVQYPFMKLEENYIQVPGSSKPLEHFFEKLDRLAFEGEGQISVVHMGGSHVQAGTLSQAMREGFQRMSPGLKGNRGFFFPFSVAKTNEPSNFTVNATGTWSGFRCSVSNHQALWGMSGITAETSDLNARVFITAYDGDTGHYSFTGIRIFHAGGDSMMFPVIDSSLYAVDTIFYDQKGFTEFRFLKRYNSFKFKIGGKSDAEKFVWQGIQYLDNSPGLSYHALGVNGASTKSYLRCDGFEEQIKVLAPDLVVFGIGINDAYMSEDRFEPEMFEARYDSIMDFMEAANPDVCFLFLTNNDSYYRRRFANPNAIAVKEVMLKLAKERDALVWDLFEVMGGLGSIDVWVDFDLAKNDRIHMTRDGYKLQAQLLMYAFEQKWLEHIREER